MGRERKGRAMALAMASALAASAALADLAPIPDHGPATGAAGGLDFAVQWVEVEMGPANGPHYTKNQQIVALTGCDEGAPNCALARSKNLIGLEVDAVDGKPLMPQKGMVQMILDAFADPKAPATITLTLYPRGADGKPIEIAFARR